MQLSHLCTRVSKLEAVCLRGGTTNVTSFAAFETAGEDQLVFLSNPKFLEAAKASSAAAIVLNFATWDIHKESIHSHGVVLCDNPYAFFAYASQLLEQEKKDSNALAAQRTIHPTALIHADVKIGKNVTVEPYVIVSQGCVIGDGCTIGAHCTLSENVVVGANTFIYPNVSVYKDVQIGSHCIIHSGTVLGSDGFGFAPHNKRWIKIPQTGTVILGDDIEIGSNCSIDRGALGNTVIGRGTKLDNLIQIAHNVQIGEDCAFAANIAIAGSAILGNRIQIGGNAGVLGHLSVCDDVIISSCTLVTKTISKPGFYSGVYPIQENAEWEKNAVVLKRLAKMREQVRDLEKQFKVSV